MVRHLLEFQHYRMVRWLIVERRDFEKHTLAICTSSFMPKLIRRLFIGGIKSRERLVRTLDDYLHNGGLDRGSPIVNAHYQAYQSYIDKSDIARFECGTALGTFANTTPVTIWTAFHIFSDAGLLQKLREQISAVTTSLKAEDGTTTIHHIDARKLRSATILFSTIEEVARYRSTGLGVRYVTEDTIVGEGYDRYSLKKDSWLIISNKSLHRDKEAWGEDADDFVADRFCRRIPHVSYRSFGNGTSACCGKNFALHYIASFMALLIMRFNIEPVDGVWKDLGQDARDSTTQTTEPNGEIPVRVTSRFNVEEGVWELSDEQRILRARGFFC
jgi:cytochrome P450